jgi:DNA invertase Pin-like site-specific DNA recombinase
MSGTRSDRPELQKLLGSLNLIDRIVIVKLDRLGRNTRHLLEIYDDLEAANVDLVSIGDNIDTSSPMGKAMRVLLSAFAQMESETTGERVSNVVTTRAERGRKHSQWPFGYRAGKPVEPQASVVRGVFQDAADGKSQRSIADRLNHERVRSSQGSTWGQSQVKAVLDNITHTGRIETNGVIYHGNHEAIVSVELWDRVQALRAANRRGRNGSAAGRRPVQPYLFTKGLLRCAHCGAAMVPHTTTSGHESYNCNTRKSQKADACDQRAVPRKLLDAAVFDYFERVCVDIAATEQELLTLTENRSAEVKAGLRDAKARAASAVAAVERLDRDYADATIDGKGYTRLAGKLEQGQTAAEASLAELERQAKIKVEPQSVADTAAMLAALRAEVAGEVADASGLDGVRARLGLLFESFEIANVESGGDAPPADEDLQSELIDLDGWVLVPVPREEWVGELDGYWQSILRPLPLPVTTQYLSQRA